ncbi:MAG: GTPase ObgE [Treponema sp.]
MLQFADEALIEVSAGKGGNGCIAFRREKYVPMGGPSGGDGGKGGDVLFEIRRNMRTLVHLRHKRVFRAKNGLDGQGSRRFGAKGADCIIPLPPGCIVKDAETGTILYDFGDKIEGTVSFLTGGNGGWGNCHFKTSTNQAPRTALSGQPGETRKIKIELNIIADIGLVGFPNAGKSSLLDYFTNARPKIAPYPFTTKIPNLGVLRIDDEQDIILADIPGILEGASEGVGLGLRFLKHISRTAGLAFLIDLSDDNYLTAYQTLCTELDSYSAELAKKKRIVIATKLDLPGTREHLLHLQEAIPDIPVLGISVYNRWGLDEVQNSFVSLVTALLQEQGAATPNAPDAAEKNFMHAVLEDPVYEPQEGFGATVSLSRKRKGRK